MKFAIKRKEQLPDALCRILGEQLQVAEQHAGGAKPNATSVHCARKAIKRARAVLKLMSCGEYRAALKRDDRALSDAGKLLAANRDVHVQQVALKRLPICKANGACAVVSKRLQTIENDVREHTTDDLKQFGDAIKAVRVKMPEWKLEEIDAAFIGKSLDRTYRRARKRFKKVCLVPTGEKIHCWRKTTKTFWHQMQLIDKIGSKKLHALSCDAERLSKILGDEHDLYMLLKALADATDRDSRAVKRELRSMRRKLTKRALKMGRKTFELAPSAFRERLSHCVK